MIGSGVGAEDPQGVKVLSGGVLTVNRLGAADCPAAWPGETVLFNATIAQLPLMQPTCS